MEIRGEDYSVQYDVDTQTVSCSGTLRLSGMEEYKPIAELLDGLVAEAPPILTLNLQGLEFLNSSGINVLSKFVIKIRQRENIKLIVQGAEAIPWQKKSLTNLQRLMPKLELTWN